MPTFLRASDSAIACRTQGVSSRAMPLRSSFFSSGLSRAGVRLPLIEDPPDLRIGVGDVRGQRVGVEPVEDLLAALVRILHQVGQRHHRVPRGLRHHLHGQALVMQRVRLAGLEQLGELELLGLRPANRQRQRFRHQNPAAEHRQIAFLAVAQTASLRRRPCRSGTRSRRGSSAATRACGTPCWARRTSCSGDVLPRASSRDSSVRASVSVRLTLPVWRAAD